MKFIFADNLDYVDPRYDFLEDRSPADRETYWDDQYPHEILGFAPYDGILISRAVVGGHQLSGKYTESQAMRLRRVGAREFLRYREEDFPHSVVFGDSGAFAYHKMSEPPYSASDMVDFYGDAGFSHGCSVDHIIFDFKELTEEQEICFQHSGESLEQRRRFDITLQNAAEFFQASHRLGNKFTPLGVIQGWSPRSMASAAQQLLQMGYRYLAVGGMVPLRSPQIHKAIEAIRSEIGWDTKLHILGFAKAEEIQEYSRHQLTSFDTTSPLLRAFKDSRNNYYLPAENGRLAYYAAIRIPQALQNNTLNNLVKEGVYSQEDLQQKEQKALTYIRAYDRGETDVDQALEAIMDYTAPLAVGREAGHTPQEKKKLADIQERILRTLNDKPWKKCNCAICQAISVEVVIFRASNRNKRRGIHNLAVYGQHLRNLEEQQVDGTLIDLQSRKSAAK